LEIVGVNVRKAKISSLEHIGGVFTDRDGGVRSAGGYIGHGNNSFSKIYLTSKMRNEVECLQVPMFRATSACWQEADAKIPASNA
jgi:hypothetical protein